MAIIGFIGWKGYNLYGAYSKSVNHGQSTTVNTVQAASEAAGGVVDGNVPLESQSGINTKLAPEQFVPTMAERPESKPLYDSVRSVKQYERIAACVKGGKTGCTCYSDQATKLTEISREMCLN